MVSKMDKDSLARSIAILQAIQAFRRIVSWCSSEITVYNMYHEDTIINSFDKYANIFDTSDVIIIEHFAKALLREAWTHRKYWTHRKQFEVILYDFNAELNVLKNLRK